MRTVLIDRCVYQNLDQLMSCYRPLDAGIFFTEAGVKWICCFCIIRLQYSNC